VDPPGTAAIAAACANCIKINRTENVLTKNPAWIIITIQAVSGLK
jgi:hypothetical protein